MIGRKTIVFLSLLGTLCLCALMAQSALAVPWETNFNTTAFECESKDKGDFTDAHCNTVKAGSGSFGHVAIPSEAPITVSNQTTKGGKTTEPTDTVLEAINGGETVKIAVREVHGLGTIKNVQPEGQHEVEGTITLEYRTIVVEEPLKCSAKEPVEFTTKFKGVKTPNKEMGLEFTAEGGVLLTIELLGNECPLKNQKLEFKGLAVATGGAGATANASGATWVFSAGNQSLSVFGEGASLTGTLTTRYTGLGDPIALTTVT